MSIIPEGFQSTSHPIFFKFKPPLLPSPPPPPPPPIELPSIPNNQDDDNDTAVSHENNGREVDEVRRCPICLSTIYDPVTIISCHHSFCYDCINAWFSHQTKCPLCNSRHIDFLRNAQPDDFRRIEHWKISRVFDPQGANHSHNASGRGSANGSGSGSASGEGNKDERRKRKQQQRQSEWELLSALRDHKKKFKVVHSPIISSSSSSTTTEEKKKPRLLPVPLSLDLKLNKLSDKQSPSWTPDATSYSTRVDSDHHPSRNHHHNHHSSVEGYNLPVLTDTIQQHVQPLINQKDPITGKYIPRTAWIAVRNKSEERAIHMTAPDGFLA
eukprot:scaffold954_cov173-Ochromonas_danica.AAC.1